MYTSQHIFKHCIRGLMKGKTVVLVTHQTELLAEADTVILMEKGQFAHCGPYTHELGVKLGAKKPSESADRLAMTDAVVESVVASASAGSGGSTEPLSPAGHGHNHGGLSRTLSMRSAPGSAASASAMLAPEARERAMSIRASILSAAAAGDVTALGGDMAPGTADLIRKTSSRRMRSLSVASDHSTASAGGGMRQQGAGINKRASVSLQGPDPHVNIKIAGASSSAPVDPLRPVRPQEAAPAVNGYWALIKETGVILVVISLLLFAGTQTIRIMSDTWISLWVSRYYPSRPETYYLEVYAGYVATFIVALLSRGVFFYAIFRAAATRLHNRQFTAIIRAPLSYFTKTPVGRILSNFSKDQDSIDESLLDAMHMTVSWQLAVSNRFAAMATVPISVSDCVHRRD